MKQNYNNCLLKVLKDEGGYTNDPSDSGGATEYGITIEDYRANINPKGTANDVRNMKLDDAKRIYKSKYWDALDCDNLSSGVDYTCFDYGVNSGLGRPRKALQRFKSLKGTELIDAINNERTAFLEALATNRPKDQKFLKGWLNRVSRVRAYSKQLAKDNMSGPVAGTVAGVTLWTTFSHYIHAHPYISVAAAVAVGAAVWTAVHYIRNRNA